MEIGTVFFPLFAVLPVRGSPFPLPPLYFPLFLVTRVLLYLSRGCSSPVPQFATFYSVPLLAVLRQGLFMLDGLPLCHYSGRFLYISFPPPTPPPVGFNAGSPQFFSPTPMSTLITMSPIRDMFPLSRGFSFSS